MEIASWEEILQGNNCRRKAKLEFERGNFEEAYNYYAEAEKHYRQGYLFPGKEVFFSQYDGLRCLENLIEEGRIEFFEVYEKKVKKFLEEWTEGTIKASFESGGWPRDKYDIEYILTLRSWRKSFYDINIKLYFAKVHEIKEEFDKSKQIYDKLIQKIYSEYQNDPEYDALLAIVKSKREILTVKEELQKPEDMRDLSIIVSGYQRAAEACKLPEDTKSRQYKRINAFKDWFVSHKFKFLAFKCLQKDMVDPEKRLTGSERYFSMAIDHARKAIFSREYAEFPEGHLWYLIYWHSIVCERLHLFRFMQGGEDKDYNLALKSWRDAMHAANKLIQQTGEESIFPNRFYSLKDLELEKEFLKAAHGFRHQKWHKCVKHLEHYCRNFPIEFYLSWRHIQLYIRLLVSKALLARGNNPILFDISSKLKDIRYSEPVGNAARYLCDYITQNLLEKLCENAPIDEKDLLKLWKHFPLDAYKESLLPENEENKYLNPLLSLPREIYYRIHQSMYPSTDEEIERLKIKLLSSIEAFLGYLYEYYLGKFYQKEDLNIIKIVAENNLEMIIGKIHQLIPDDWRKKREFINNLANLKNAVEQLIKADDIRSYCNAYDKIYQAIRVLVKFSPVIVKIDSIIPARISLTIDKLPEWLYDLEGRRESYRVIVSQPDWLISEYRSGREKIFISLPTEKTIETGEYYLPPEWRKGNRLFYLVSKRRQQVLLKTHFKPRWAHWDSEEFRLSTLKIMKQKAVMVLGKYASKEEEKKYEDELYQVKKYLKDKGYNAYLIKELSDTTAMGPEDKSTYWMREARFCVMIDRVPSGANIEYKHVKSHSEIILAILRPQGCGSTSLMDDAYIYNISWIKFFEFKTSFLEVIDNAVRWAEEEIKNREIRKIECEKRKWKGIENKKTEIHSVLSKK